ncbi:hypothetical protein GOP47_0002474 [Adiantum capillus-veneris]|uniref:RNA helicase n=1 Tax=Adiantum capillus-veneris TaxID=13818 RepID=A0A9D4VBN2_ADICA|nr:hypothetical protein GOP47_0002474 [Adiantum capillus-veneris]
MGKAEEYQAKKRNKAARKRLSNTVDFTHGVQAAKRRRKAGRRRICEGMCYSLPTPKDPFNDSYKENLAKKKVKEARRDGDNDLPYGKTATKVGLNQEKKARAEKSKANVKSSSAESNKFEKSGSNTLPKRSEAEMRQAFVTRSGPSNHVLSNGENDAFQRQAIHFAKYKWKPSCENCSKNNNSWTCVGGDAFEVALCALLNADMVKNEEYEVNAAVEQKVPFEKCIGSKWDWLFWEACGTGSNVLVTGRAAIAIFQISSVLAAVAHIGTRRAPQIQFKDPIALFLVQSKEHTLQVRSIFRVFKSLLGLHAVSLHPQTALEHQIEGLRSTEAEVLVATPERLCELLSINAVSLTNISFMVVDGVEEMVSCGLADDLLQVKGRVPDNVQVVLSSGHFPHSMHDICRKLLEGPIRRVMSNISLPQSCACICQNVHFMVSYDKRQQKLKNILRDHMESRENGASPQGPVVLCRRQLLSQVKDMIQEEGYSVDVLSDDNIKTNQSGNLVLEQFRNGQVEVLIATEDCVSQIDLADIGIIVLYEFPASIEFYQQILMRMARNTINGVLYSFCSGATAPLASQLIAVLQECHQPIPSSLRMLADAAQVVEQSKGS